MAGKCSNLQCQVESTGLCLEGLTDLSDCSSFNGNLIEEIKISEEKEEAIIQNSINDTINLLGQLTLDSDGTDISLKSHGGRIIACVGPANVGKTTLFASIYDLFQQGAVADWNFGGSRTIFSFEELCHSARYVSNMSRPDTPRTFASDGLSFYHLSLYDDSNNRQDLFLADRAGEIYSNAADRSEACENLLEVSRADVVLVLVDAKSLGDLSRRHFAKRQALNIIEAFSESSLIKPGTTIVITLTRYDLAIENKSNVSAEEEFKKIINSATDILGSNVVVVGEIIAARPDSSQWATPGYGLPSLLKRIIDHDISKPGIVKNKPVLPDRSFLDPEFAL